MNGQDAKADLFEMKNLNPTKEDYERDVRDAILDYQIRCKDVGDNARARHTAAELSRLDEKFGIKK